MILIALGSNLPSTQFGAPLCILEAALARLGERGIVVRRRSRWYASAPVPKADMPWFVNGVAEIATTARPEPLMRTLHALETTLGRSRGQRWEARSVDLDLLAYQDLVLPGRDSWHDAGNDVSRVELTLPHPRLHRRAFVLVPLSEIAPTWRHPVLQRTAAELRDALTHDQRILPLHG